MVNDNNITILRYKDWLAMDTNEKAQKLGIKNINNKKLRTINEFILTDRNKLDVIGDGIALLKTTRNRCLAVLFFEESLTSYHKVTPKEYANFEALSHRVLRDVEDVIKYHRNKEWNIFLK